MKYIITFREDSSVSQRFTLPALMESIEATRPYVEEHVKKNRVLDWGFIGNDCGLYAIVNVKNIGELHEFTELLPLRRFCSIECNPVLDSSEFADTFGKIKTNAIQTWERLNRDVKKNSY